MRDAQYTKATAERVAFKVAESERRAMPVGTGCGDLTEVLAGLVLAWPPRDVRLDPAYRESHDVTDTSDVYARDVADGARVREQSRRPGAGRLVVALDFHSNMAQFERYNSVVRDHNREWIDAGEPADSIDAWTGDISPVEGWVDFAQSEEHPRLGDGGGALDSARPSAVRSVGATVEYRAFENPDGTWTLGFVARDRADRALCWHEESGPDLAVLVRRSVQMLYGNHRVPGCIGPLSDGLSLLMRGEKVRLCQLHCRRPRWMDAAPKGVTFEQVDAAVERTASGAAHGVLAGLVPVVAIIGMLVWAAHCLVQTWGEVPGPHAGMGWFLAGEAVLCAALWLGARIGTSAKRHAEAVAMRERYL